MANKDLFAQAIADAKKLKEISMANAKQAIEEAFAPRIQEMFRMKLSEMEGLEEDENLEEVENLEEFELDKGKLAAQSGDKMQKEDEMSEESLEEILAELELEESLEEDSDEPMEEGKQHFGAGYTAVKTEAAKKKKEEPAEEEAEEDAEPAKAEDSENAPEGDNATFSVEEIMSIIQSALAGAAGEEASEEESPEGAAGDNKEFALEESISLDEILAELQENGLEELDLKGMAKGAFQSVANLFKGTPKECIERANAADPSSVATTLFDKVTGKVKSQKWMAELQACRKEHGMAPLVTARPSLTGGGFNLEEEENLEELDLKGMAKGAFKSIADMFKGTPKECIERANAADPSSVATTLYDKLTGKVKSQKWMAELQACRKEHGMAPLVTARPSLTGGGFNLEEEENLEELNEAIKVIKALKAELNEVNLLNAKLLYVNKLFKAKALSEAQKVKVITAFDRAESVKEVKNIYATLNESLTATTAATSKKGSIKESLGFASKPIGNAPVTPIVEADAYVVRMQQLAGLRQPNI